MVTAELIYGLAALALLASLAWHVGSERTATVRHQVLELAAAAARRQRPIADLLQASAQGQRRQTARLLEDLGEALDAGMPLSEALAEAPQHFPADLRDAVAAAEDGAHFAATLEALATEADTTLTAAHRRHLALAYPLVLAIALCACWEVTAPAFGAIAQMNGTLSERGTTFANSMLGATGIGRLGPAIVLAILAVAYLWMLSVASRTRWGQRILGRVRDLLSGPASALVPGRRRRHRARLLGVLARAVGSGAPLHEALALGAQTAGGRLGGRAHAAAELAHAGAGPLEVFAPLRLPDGETARLAACRSGDRLAAVLTDLARQTEAAIAAHHERWLQRIPVLAVCLFGLLVADHFAALMQMIEVVRTQSIEAAGGAW